MTVLIAAYMPAWKDPPETVTIPTWGNGPWINTPPINYMSDHPERWPSYGAVNEDDQAIIDLQLGIAASAGITAFAVNWYDRWACEYGIQRLLLSTSSSPVKSFVQWSNHYASMDSDVDNKPVLYEGIRRASLYMIGSYAARYYQRNGRPVLAIFSSQALDDVIRFSTGHDASYTPTLTERNALVADMRNVVGNVLSGDTTGGISGSTVSPSANPGPFLVIYDRSWANVVGVDAMTMYSQHAIVINPGTPGQVIRNAHSYDEIDTGCQQTWGTGAAGAAANGKEYWPTVMPSGWDRTPWGGTAGDSLADNCKPTRQQLWQHCESAKAAASEVSANGTAFVYAFNEPGESYSVNPSQGDGTMFVDTLKAVFSAPTDWVTIQGTNFLRPDGTIFFPFGTSTRWGQMQEADFAYMASLGLNCVRIPFNVCGQAAAGDADAPGSPSTGYLDPAYIAQLLQYTDWGKAAGLLVHWVFRTPCYRSGAPIDDNGNPVPDPYCGDTSTFPNGSNVWTDPTKKTRWLAQLSYLAALRASDPSVYSIEVMSEPDPYGFTGAQVNAMMVSGYNAVRAANPNILVGIGGTSGYGPANIGASFIPGATGVWYTYDWFNFASNPDPEQSLIDRAAYATAFRLAHRVPLNNQQFGSKIGDDPPRDIMAFQLQFNLTNRIACEQWEIRCQGSPPAPDSYGWIDANDNIRTTDEDLMRTTAAGFVALGGGRAVSSINGIQAGSIAKVNGVDVTSIQSINGLAIT